MTVYDEEFSKQLWEYDWNQLEDIGGYVYHVKWEETDLAVRESYLNVVRFIRNSEWLSQETNDAYNTGYNDGTEWASSEDY
jgi:hypothetical protein